MEILLSVDQDLLLKNLDLSLTRDLFLLVDSNRLHLRQFLGWLDVNTSEIHTKKFIEKEIQSLENGFSITLGIHYKKKLAGLISLTQIDQISECATIGYWLAKNYEGLGIMTKSTQAVINYAFEKLGLHRLELRCAIINVKSKKVAERLNFTMEGILKEAIPNYGKYFDAYMFGLLNNKNLPGNY